MFDLTSFNTSIDKFLGVTVWWTVNQASVTVDKVKSALQNAGLAEDLTREPTAKRAFTRSAKDLTRNSDNRFARKIVDGIDKAVVGIVHETSNVKAETLDYQQQTTARLDKQTGAVTVEGADAEDFQQKFEHYSQNVTDADLRLMIRQVVREACGVALRESGGIYFIPRQYVEKLVAVDSFLRELGVGQMYLLRLPDGETERRVAWDAAQEEVQLRVEAVITAVESIDKRISAVEKHEARLSEINTLVQFYSELTGIEEVADGIKEKLQEAERKISNKMAELQSNGRPSKAKAKAKVEAEPEVAPV